MHKRMKGVLKKVAAGMICLASMTSMIVSAMPLAMSKASYETLDTSTALGSPLLNTKNFSTEDWNEYETLCWGVFLSNFCQPLVDTYESAFRDSVSYGSRGKGYRALWNGGGSDSANADVVHALCEYAIDHQFDFQETIYVKHTLSDTKSDTKMTPPAEEGTLTKDSAGVREASFRDLWYYGASDKYNDSAYTKDTYTYAVQTSGGEWDISATKWVIESESMDKQYDGIATVHEASLPTFYVERDGKLVTILDYNDWWDCQLISWMGAAVKNTDDAIAKQFKANFETMWNEDATLHFDAFGNIVTKSGERLYMTIPAVINQNITGEPTINTLNSWTMNSYTNTLSDEQVVLGLRQNLQTFKWFWGDDDGSEEFFNDVWNGYPAFGQTTVGNIGLFYYDLDSLYVRNHANNDGTYVFGDNLLDLMSLDINNDKTSDLAPLKFEISGNGAPTYGVIFAGTEMTSTSPASLMSNSAMVSGMLADLNFAANKLNSGTKENSKFRKTLLHEIIKPNGDIVNIFPRKGVMIPVKVKLSTLSAEQNSGTNEGATRLFYNYIYDRYQNTTNTTEVNRASITQYLKGVDSESFFDKCKEFLMATFKSDYSAIDYSDTDPLQGEHIFDWDYGNNETANCLNTTRCVVAYPPSEPMRTTSTLMGIKDGTEFSTYCSYIYMTYLEFYGIQSSETLTGEIQNNSKFNSVLFNTEERKKVLIDNIAEDTYHYGTDFAENLDIDEANKQFSFLMLSPDQGRDYRKQIIDGTITDWIYEQYNRMVYGGATEFAGSASKAKSGFMYIPTYDENPFTSAFLEFFPDIATVMILGGALIILVFGLLKRRKFTWFIVSMVVMLNTVLIVPSSGDMVPYVTSNAVNGMYSQSMTFWAISEAVTNARFERDAFEQRDAFEHLTEEESNLVLDLVSELSVVQVDGDLSVKQDISQKVTQFVAEGVYSDIESYQSARWILPMVMQQFSANEEENLTKFIYKPVSNIWTDLSNMYWYFAPIDAEITHGASPTLTSGQGGQLPCANYANSEEALEASNSTGDDIVTQEEFNDDIITEEDEAQAKKNKQATYQVYDKFKLYDNLTNLYPDNVKVADRKDGSNVNQGEDKETSSYRINYRCYSYSTKDAARQVHLISSYLTDGYRVPLSRKSVFGEHGENYKDADSWASYIKASNEQIANKLVWETNYKDGESSFKGLEYTSDAYERGDRGTINADLPYLWATEQPIYYFYSVVKDTFNYDDSLGKLVYHLQGRTTLGKDVDASGQNWVAIENMIGDLYDDEIVRNNFMYATITRGNETAADTDENRDAIIPTGKVRDVLDLEEMFTNTIPYLYQMSITANGFDGKSGILGDKKITEESEYYEGELQSWMYRCNWATKIMENPKYSEPVTVRDGEGNKHTVNNPLFYECYPDNRPMVFSDAQKYALGLEDRDLNIVELKCCELNRKVARSWTLLLNYAGTAGITREILLRQMATDATLLFCEEFSSSGIVDTKYELYPSALDLRYTSFDSIMKQLMLNVSRDTSYIYGDTMLTVISHGDIFTGVLLLIATLLCASITPLFRVILLALVFYLGFLAIFRGLMYSRGTKLKIACGQVITNLLFTGYTLAYFFIFKILMSLTNSDQVLNVNRIKAEMGSPIWLLVVIIIVSIIYIVIMFKHIKFCYSTRSDMGYSAYSQMASSIAGAVKNTASNVKNNVSNLFGGKEGSSATYDATSATSLSGGTLGFGGNSDTSNTGNSGNGSSSSVDIGTSNNSNTSNVSTGDTNNVVVSNPTHNTNNNTLNDIDANSSDYNIDIEKAEADTGDSLSTDDINTMIETGATIGNEDGTFNPYE